MCDSGSWPIFRKWLTGKQVLLCSAQSFYCQFSDKTVSLVSLTFLKAFQVLSKIWVFCGFLFYLYGEASVEPERAVKKLREFGVACGGMAGAHRLPSPCGEVC